MRKLHVELEAEECLFEEGDEGHCAYVIDSGVIEILRRSPDGEQSLSTLGPGAFFGEMALISRQPRMASAVARVPSKLSVLTHEHLQERLDRSDPLIRHLLHLSLQRYRHSLTDESESISLLSGEDESQANRRMKTEVALLEALDNDELELFFQPIVRLADGVTAGFEALLRWNRPGVGRVAPDEFIPIAEDSHIILKIGQWIIQEACRCRPLLPKAWSKPLADDFSISINLAARQLPDRDLIPCIEQAMQEYQVAPQCLRLEVTESQIMEDLDEALSVLHGIKALGCKIAIDDFGTGHSSLAYLHRLPVDTLKIDKAFLLDALQDSASQTIIAGVARLAKELQLTLIAEGAEDQEQIDLLRHLGVEQIQGYFFGKPFSVKQA